MKFLLHLNQFLQAAWVEVSDVLWSYESRDGRSHRRMSARGVRPEPGNGSQTLDALRAEDIPEMVAVVALPEHPIVLYLPQSLITHYPLDISGSEKTSLHERGAFSRRVPLKLQGVPA